MLGSHRVDVDASTRIVVVKLKGALVGVVVDAVSEVVDLRPSDITPPPNVKHALVRCGVITGMGWTSNRLLILLDIQALLAAVDLSALDHVRH